MLQSEGINLDSLITAALLSVFAGFLVWTWFRTGYETADGCLVIWSGPVRKTVRINEMTRVRKTKNMFVAYALSRDRLEISYGKFDNVLVSPENETELLRLLLKENPEIGLDTVPFN